MRIFLIFIMLFVLFNAPVYSLMPSSREEDVEEELTPPEIEKEIDQLKKLKQDLMEEVSPLREERAKNLHPFVYKVEPPETYEAFPSEIEDRQVRYAVKDIPPSPIDKGSSRQAAASQGLVSRPLLNFIFFSVIALALLASYLFIRPKP